MFTRFVRLGVPLVLLDRQGRARPELARLYSWRYPVPGVSTDGNDSGNNVGELGNLPCVLAGSAADADSNSEFARANAGFRHTMQLVDVPDFQGAGERCPTPHFYQNLGEAEYVVAVFQYMCLLGYPPHKISILTTYNGQKSLIKDILAQRCGDI